MIKILLTLKILIKKIIKLNIAFLKNEVSGYPQIVSQFEKQITTETKLLVVW